jgi:hypothetical protein
MLKYILCLLTLLIVVQLLLPREGFSDVCIPVPTINTQNITIFLIAVVTPLAIIAFYTWNWDTLRTKTDRQIIKHYLFNSKITN